MTSTIGIPIKLLNEAQVNSTRQNIPVTLLKQAQGHIVTLEITSGQTYRGKLLEGTLPFASPFLSSKRVL